MLIQTKDAKDKMIAAGFNRSDFSVNVERHYIPNSKTHYGKAMFEYGSAQITIKSNSAYKNIPNMISNIIDAGLGVDEYISQNRNIYIITTKHNKHNITNLDNT